VTAQALLAPFTRMPILRQLSGRLWPAVRAGPRRI